MRPEFEYLDRILNHYMRMVWEQAGLRWDSDNTSEIRCAVEGVEKAFQDLQDRVAALEQKNGPER